MSLGTIRLLWGAIFFSTFLELGIVLWADFDRHVDLHLETTLAIALAALSCAVASAVLPNRLYDAALARLSLPVVESPTQEPGRDYRTAAGTRRVFRDDVRDALLRAYQTPFILGIALAESVALFGLALAQGRLAPSSYGLPFFAIAWALLVFRFPRAKPIVLRAERLYSARLS